MEKTLLTPLNKGQIPQAQLAVPERNAQSWAYQDAQGRYFFGAFPALEIPPHPTDTLYVLQGTDVARPDLMAYRFYGSPAYYWIILRVNNIADPFEGMYPGMLLRIPTRTRLNLYGVRA